MPLLLFFSLLAASAVAQEAPELVFIVQDYRYHPGAAGDDPDLGHTLCSTRCYALSVDYLTYMEPGRWRMIKVASARELTVALNNPFMGGDCVCIADEYLVKIDQLYISGPK